MGESVLKSHENAVRNYAKVIKAQTGKAIRPLREGLYHEDGFVNMLNKYGTSKDTSESYFYSREPMVPDDVLTSFYEGNGLFAKIIDTPAEEALKHGFTLTDVSDDTVLDFMNEALDELDWEETAMTAIKWARLYGGSLAVMLINDGRNLEDPLDWKHIQSIDDIRVYDRSHITADYPSMFVYEPTDPFRTRASRLGTPERFYVNSKYGNFWVHESRCLMFRNGILPENTTCSEYEIWGIPEYVRLHRAIRDAELAHGSATKMLDKSVQPVYKMKDLANLLATEQGEEAVLRRLQTIDMARGLLSSITIDSEGEDYDFRQFQYSGVSDVIDATCNFLSAISSIPQTILFGRSPAGMNATGTSDLENFYNLVERLRKRTLKSNLRYLLSVVFQAGLYTGEIEEMPKIKVEFNPLWSLSEQEQADLDQKKAQTQLTKAQTATAYVQMQALDPTEVRKKLASEDEFDVESLLDEYDIEDDELFPSNVPGQNTGDDDGNSTEAAPAATKLPEDKTQEELLAQANTDSKSYGSVGVLVVKDGKILCGRRMNDTSRGTICGPGGHIEKGETPEQAAARESNEEFGIEPKELIEFGRGPEEYGTGLAPHLFLCTEYDGEVKCDDVEMTDPQFISLDTFKQLEPSLYQPFKDQVYIFLKELAPVDSSPFVQYRLFDPPQKHLNNVQQMDSTESTVDGTKKPSRIEKLLTKARLYRKIKSTSNMPKQNGNFDSINEDTNKSLPFGLCAEEGIELPQGATPEDAWNALKEKTGKTPEEYYKERYQKGGSRQKVTHFRTKGSEMKVTYDLELCRKTNRGKSKAGVLLKGEKISKISCFAGKGSGKNLVVSGILSKQYPGTKPADWMHKSGSGQVIDSQGNVTTADIHWFEHEKVGQVGFKIKT